MNNEVVAHIMPLGDDSDTPAPTCPAVGSIQTVDSLNRTNRYFMIHIHYPETIRLEGVGVVENGIMLLQQFAQMGIPTNKLFAVSDDE